MGAARGSALKTRDGGYPDIAFDPVPAKYTILHDLDVPSNGGNTCFANTEMVYRLLDDHQQRLLIGLQAEFAYGGRATNDRNQLAAEALSEEDKAASIAVHPVLSAHHCSRPQYVGERGRRNIEYSLRLNGLSSRALGVSMA